MAGASSSISAENPRCGYPRRVIGILGVAEKEGRAAASLCSGRAGGGGGVATVVAGVVPATDARSMGRPVVEDGDSPQRARPRPLLLGLRDW